MTSRSAYLKLQPDILRSYCIWGGKEYRYALLRQWDEKLPKMVIIGLNPSVADEKYDDRTVRKCISFARREGFGSLIMLNIFAYRSTDPKALEHFDKAVGYLNDFRIVLECDKADKIIIAWGTNGDIQDRGKFVLKLLEGRKLFCFGINKCGSPKHPLYLRSDTKIVPYE